MTQDEFLLAFRHEMIGIAVFGVDTDAQAGHLARQALGTRIDHAVMKSEEFLRRVYAKLQLDPPEAPKQLPVPTPKPVTPPVAPPPPRTNQPTVPPRATK